MYDVYLSAQKDLLVVPSGISVPSELNGSWRQKKRAVRSVSEKIRADVELRGYHRRKLVGRAAADSNWHSSGSLSAGLRSALRGEEDRKVSSRGEEGRQEGAHKRVEKRLGR